MKWVKAKNNKVAFRSGANDKAAPSELPNCLQNLLDMFEEVKDNETTKKEVALAAKKQDKMELEAICLSSMNPRSANAALLARAQKNESGKMFVLFLDHARNLGND